MKLKSKVMLAVAAFYSAAASAGLNIHEGLWEVTAVVQVKGLAAQLPAEPQRQTQCLTRADIEHPENLIPPQANCSLRDVVVTDNQVRWQIQCSAPLAAQGSGLTTYNRDTFTGTADMVSQSGGLKVEISTTYQGRRLGDCK